MAFEEKRIAFEKKMEIERETALERERTRSKEFDLEKEVALEKQRMANELELKKLEVTMNGSSGGKSGGVKTPRLPIFQDGKESLDAYLERFERFPATQKSPKEHWASNLSALVAGKALEMYSHLSVQEVNDFETLKKALLSRYNLNAE